MYFSAPLLVHNIQWELFNIKFLSDLCHARSFLPNEINNNIDTIIEITITHK